VKLHDGIVPETHSERTESLLGWLDNRIGRKLNYKITFLLWL